MKINPPIHSHYQNYLRKINEEKIYIEWRAKRVGCELRMGKTKAPKKR